MVTQCGMDSLLLLLWDCGSGLGSSKHFWHKYEELLCTGSQQHFTTCENFTSACYYKSLLLSADGENTWDMIYEYGREKSSSFETDDLVEMIIDIRICGAGEHIFKKL